jgi:hypothetical protein
VIKTKNPEIFVPRFLLYCLLNLYLTSN